MLGFVPFTLNINAEMINLSHNKLYVAKTKQHVFYYSFDKSKNMINC